MVYEDNVVKLTQYGFQHSVVNPQVAQPLRIYHPAETAPEVLKKSVAATGEEGFDEREVDVFCFGLLLFQIITRQPLYPLKIPPLILGIKISKGMIPTVPDYVPEELRDIMIGCWQRPGARPKIGTILKLLLSFHDA